MADPEQAPSAITLSTTGDISIGDISIGGDVVGRDKIINTIQQFYERALTATEAAAQTQAHERQMLALGVGACIARLRARVSEPDEDALPYRGLLEYRLRDAEWFFGRDRAIRELLSAVRLAPLTVLHAESGAGKTSLLQAGLAPQLITAAHLPLIIRPYNQNPATVIKRALLPNLSGAPGLASAPLAEFLRAVSEILGGGSVLYVLLDQFEEFFTQLPDAEQVQFVHELAACLDDTSLSVSWVLSLRSDYFSNLATFRPHIRNPFANDYRLQRLSRAEAQAAIVEPARRRGLQFAAGLVDQLLDDLGGDTAIPPHLQLVCVALTAALEPGVTTLGRDSYEREGGAAGILRGHLDRVLSRDLPVPLRGTARRLLAALVDSEQRRLVRTPDELERELAAGQTPIAETRATLAQLLDSRLLKTVDGELGLAYELAHDYLLDEIKLDPETQARKAVQELLDQEVRAFERFHTLLTAERLALILPYRAELRLSVAAERLLDASQDATARQHAEAEARQQRELRALRKLAQAQEQRRPRRYQWHEWLFPGLLAVVWISSCALFGTMGLEMAVAVGLPQIVVGSFVLFVVALIVFAFSRQGEDTVAHDAEFSPDGAMLLTASGCIRLWNMNGGLEHELHPGVISSATFRPDSAAVLLATASGATIHNLQGRQLTALKPPTSSRASFLAISRFSPDGQTVLTRLLPNYLQIWDTSGTLLAALSGCRDGVFSPDGATVLTRDSRDGARLWSRDGHILASLTGHSRTVQALAFSPDGARVATAGADGTARIWSLDGDELLVLSGHTGALTSVAFHPDGRHVLTAGADGTARIWDRDGTQLALLDEHTGPVVSARYSPDGSAIITAGKDGTAKLWSAGGQYRVELIRQVELPPPLYAARFSPDSQRIVTMDLSDAHLWDRAGQLIASMRVAPDPQAGGDGGGGGAGM